MSFDELPPTISVDQAAAILCVSSRAVYHAASKGELPTVRIGRRLLVPTSRFLAMLGVDSRPTVELSPST